MRRRDFMTLMGVSAGARTLAPDQSRQSPAVRARLRVGTQHGSSDEILRVLAALGVNHICSSLPSARLDENWSASGLSRLRERVESFGIRLEMVPLPLSSHYIAKSENPNI